jgi:hypothetical protein
MQNSFPRRQLNKPRFGGRGAANFEFSSAMPAAFACQVQSLQRFKNFCRVASHAARSSVLGVSRAGELRGGHERGPVQNLPALHAATRGAYAHVQPIVCPE